MISLGDIQSIKITRPFPENTAPRSAWKASKKFHVHQPKCTKQRRRCSISSMKTDLRVDTQRRRETQKTTPQNPRPHVPMGFGTSSGPTDPPPPSKQRPHSVKPSRALSEKPLSHAEQQLSRPGRPFACRPHADPRPRRAPLRGDLRGPQRPGGAAAASASLFLWVAAPTPGAAAKGGRSGGERPTCRSRRGSTPGIVSRPCCGASQGRQEPSLGPRRQNDASVFVLPGLAGGLPSPGRRHPRPAPASPLARGAPVPSLPPPARQQAARLPPLTPYHSPCGGPNAKAGFVRETGTMRLGRGLREG